MTDATSTTAADVLTTLQIELADLRVRRTQAEEDARSFSARIRN
jgi:hypothetical protein